MSYPRDLAILLLALTSGCRTVAFTDGAALTVLGTPPAPVAAPAPPPRPERIELRDKIHFARNSARILADSYGVLDEVAVTILSTTEIDKIRIEGHASSDGNDKHNLFLSADRAESVRQYLIGQGVADEKLVSKGFGEARPISDNETRQGREENRRVELHIVEWAS